MSENQLASIGGGMINTIEDVEKLGKWMADAGLYGITKPAQAIGLILVMSSECKSIAAIFQRWHLMFDGRMAQRADWTQGEFEARGGEIVWHVLTDEMVAATFLKKRSDEKEAKRIVARFQKAWEVKLETDPKKKGKFVSELADMNRSGEVVVIRTYADAEEKGLTLGKGGTKDNWRRSPQAMLVARSIMEGVRLVMPSVVAGNYCAEELDSVPTIEDAKEAAGIDPALAEEFVPTKEPKAEKKREGVTEENWKSVVYTLGRAPQFLGKTMEHLFVNPVIKNEENETPEDHMRRQLAYSRRIWDSFNVGSIGQLRDKIEANGAGVLPGDIDLVTAFRFAGEYLTRRENALPASPAAPVEVMKPNAPLPETKPATAAATAQGKASPAVAKGWRDVKIPEHWCTPGNPSIAIPLGKRPIEQLRAIQGALIDKRRTPDDSWDKDERLFIAAHALMVEELGLKLQKTDLITKVREKMSDLMISEEGFCVRMMELDMLPEQRNCSKHHLANYDENCLCKLLFNWPGIEAQIKADMAHAPVEPKAKGKKK